MDTLVMLSFKYGELNAIARFAQLSSYFSVVEFVCSRWPSLNKDSISLLYVLPDNSSCLLENEEDYLNMGIMLVYSGAKLVVHVKESQAICAYESSTSTVRCGGSISNEPEHSSSSRLALEMHVNFFHHGEKELLTAKWAKEIIGIRQVFEGGITEFRISLCKYACEVGFSFEYIKNDKKRVTAQCKHKSIVGCPWRIHASVEKSNGFDYIKTYTSSHTCGDVHRSEKGRRVTSDVLAESIVDVVRSTPSIGTAQILRFLKTSYGLDVSYKVGWKAIEKARAVVYGGESLSYDNLRGYFKKMKELDVTNQFVLESDKVGHFKRCFVSFGACIRGFRFCRPMLFVDGTFLHGKYKGTLLAETAKDGNSGLFNIAFAIVGGEDTANWIWFLEQLKPLIDYRQVTFVSDRHQGIIQVVKDVLPKCFHSFCIVHLKHNLKDKMRGCHISFKNRMTYKLSQCAEAPTEELFNSFLNEMKAEGGAVVQEFLDNLLVENYANAFFNSSRYGEMSSNVAESFNAQFKVARSLPIMELIDYIRLKLMCQMSKRREDSSKWNTTLSPLMDKKYEEHKKIGRSWVVYSSSNNVFEVHSVPPMVVNDEECTCSCGKWQHEGFPCVHAVAVLFNTKPDSFLYIEPFFHCSYYRECYASHIQAYASFGQAPTTEPPVILPPVIRRPPGRPRKNRIPSRGEVMKRKMKCGRCGKLGTHNRKSCREPI